MYINLSVSTIIIIEINLMIVHIDTAWNTSYANAILFILSILRVLCYQCTLILVLMDFGETDLDISE